jgi:hypothetical protein
MPILMVWPEVNLAQPKESLVQAVGTLEVFEEQPAKATEATRTETTIERNFIFFFSFKKYVRVMSSN